MNKIAVCTAITNNRDPLREEQITNDADFICFTDNINLKSDVWETRKAYDLYNDPARNAKIHKVLAHKYLNKYKYILWIDANVSLIVPAKTLVKKYLSKNNIALFVHNTGRDCIYGEAEICKNLKLDNKSLIDEQMAQYRKEGCPEHNGLLECTILLRKNCEEVERFNNSWWAEICRYSKRDQISFNYLLWKLGINVGVMKGDIIENKYFIKELHSRNVKDINNTIGTKEINECFPSIDGKHNHRFLDYSCTWRHDTLREFMLKIKPKIAVEIGTHKGLSTAVFASICDEVYTFDIKYQPDTKIIWQSLGMEDNIHYTIITKGSSMAKLLNHIPFDFAFIDAEIDYKYIKIIYEIVKRCGRVLIHDIDLPGREKLLEEIGGKKMTEKFGYWEDK